MRTTTHTLIAVALLFTGCGGHSSSSRLPKAHTVAPPVATKKPDVLTGIRVQPTGELTIEQKRASAFQIIVDGQYHDNRSRPLMKDLTRVVSYTVVDPRVAQISGSGLITPLAIGRTTILVEMSSPDGTFRAKTNVNVVKPSKSRPVFTAVDIMPETRTLWDVNPHAHRDDFQQMIVIGTDQTGRKHDLTRAVGVQLQDPSGRLTNIASVDPLGLLRGRAFGEVIAVGRIDSFGLLDGASIVCGRSPATPINPNSIYNGAPLAGSTNPIDLAVLEGLRVGGVEPAALADDGEFLRRLYADAIGRSPTEADFNAFTASTASNKRETEINDLVASPEFALHWSSIMGEWLVMPRKVKVMGTTRGNYDFTVARTLTLTVDGGAPQAIRLESSMFSDPTNVFSGAVVRELNKLLVGARAIRLDNYVHIETMGTGPGTSLSVASGGMADIIGLGGQNGTVIDTWARSQIASGRTLGQMFTLLAEGGVPAFEARHTTAADKVDVFLLAGTGNTARCAKCHDHPLPGPNDAIRWTQDERYPLDAFFAMNPTEATKLDGKTGLRFDPPKQPGYVLDSNATITTTLQDPIADRRAEFASVFTASDAFMQGLGHRIFAQVMTPLLDPNQFLQTNLDGVMVPAVFAAIPDVFRAQNTSLQGFVRTIFSSRAYQLTSATAGLDTANDPFLQRRTLRLRYAEVFDHALSEATGSTATRPGREFIHQVFGHPARRLTATERVSAVNMSQSFLLLNSPVVQDRIKMTTSLAGRLASQIGSGAITRAEAVQSLFRTALSRDADSAELTLYLDTINQAPTVREGLEDCAAATVAIIEFGLH